MNNINKIDKVTLEFLINPDIYERHIKKINNKEKEDFNNDKYFYKKRILSVIKEMLKGNFENENLRENFNNYIESIIVYFKEIDRKDLLQEYYLDLSFNSISVKEKLNTIYEEDELDEYLYNKEKLEKPTIDKFVKIKKTNNKEYFLPEKRDIDLKNPKLRKKGVLQKEKYNNNINEN